MIARYLRPFEVFDPAWFYLHVGCQLLGYAGGTAGWILGLKLQQVASPIKYKHRNLGIAIWALATFQVNRHSKPCPFMSHNIVIYLGCFINKHPCKHRLPYGMSTSISINLSYMRLTPKDP